MTESRDVIRGSRVSYERGAQMARWPTGSEWIGHSDLPSTLADSAQWHCRNALRHYADQDLNLQLSAAVSVGCAVELLAKSYLASVDPVLLIERNDLDTLLHLSGKGKLASSSPTSVKTISASGAISNAKRMLRGMPYAPAADEIVFRVRNCALHLALVDSDELNDAVASMVRLADYFVAESPWKDRTRFWGSDLIVVADAIADELADERIRAIARKMTLAKMRLAALTAGLDQPAALAVFAALSSMGPHASIDHDERTTCPVCDQPAWLVCMVEETTAEVKTGEGLFYVPTERIAWPHVFICNVCDLELVDDELRDFEQFPEEIVLPVEDYSGWEPDEDYFGGR